MFDCSVCRASLSATTVSFFSAHSVNTASGGPVNGTRHVTTLKTVWNTIREKAWIKGRCHYNRHTLITELAESGAGDQTIMDIAGHVSKQMLKHYSQIRMEGKRNALESIVKKPTAAGDSIQQNEGSPQSLQKGRPGAESQSSKGDASRKCQGDEKTAQAIRRIAHDYASF
jgi:Phage integrase family